MEGIVFARHGKQCRVRQAGVEQELLCSIRPGAGQPVVGDRVQLTLADHNTGVVTCILPRRNVLTRIVGGKHAKALAANLDDILVVFAAEPAPSCGLIDNYLVAAHLLQATPILVRNKSDLESQAKAAAIIEQYAQTGYETLSISASTGQGREAMLTRLAGREAALVGQSGVGKSSLINCLLPDGQTLETQALSANTQLGRHTTSTATLHALPGGGLLVDSPGVRSFELGPVTAADAASAFLEFRPYIGQCKYPNCSHRHEPNCAILDAVAKNRILRARHESYCRIISPTA